MKTQISTAGKWVGSEQVEENYTYLWIHPVEKHREE